MADDQPSLLNDDLDVDLDADFDVDSDVDLDIDLDIDLDVDLGADFDIDLDEDEENVSLLSGKLSGGQSYMNRYREVSKLTSLKIVVVGAAAILIFFTMISYAQTNASPQQPALSHDNYCEADSCMNGGTCINTRGSAKCECVKGYDGHLCENTKATGGQTQKERGGQNQNSGGGKNQNRRGVQDQSKSGGQNPNQRWKNQKDGGEQNQSKAGGQNQNKAGEQNQNKLGGQNLKKGGGQNQNKAAGQNGSKSGGQNQNKSGGQTPNKSGGQNQNKGGGQNQNKGGGQDPNKAGGQNRNRPGGHTQNKSGGQNQNKGGGQNENKGGGQGPNKAGGQNRNQPGGQTQNKGGQNEVKGGGQNQNKSGGQNQNKGGGQSQNKGVEQNQIKAGGQNQNKAGEQNQNKLGGQNQKKVGGQNQNKAAGQNGSKSGGQTQNKSGGQNQNKGGGQNQNKGGGQDQNKAGGQNLNRPGGQNQNKPGGQNQNKGVGQNKIKGGGQNQNKGVGQNQIKGGGQNQNKSGGLNQNKGGGQNQNKDSCSTCAGCCVPAIGNTGPDCADPHVKLKGGDIFCWGGGTLLPNHCCSPTLDECVPCGNVTTEVKQEIAQEIDRAVNQKFTQTPEKKLGNTNQNQKGNKNGKSNKQEGNQEQYPKTDPNIIFVLVDDMGYGDVAYNGAEYETQTIDALAFSGVLLDNYYVNPVGAPTRISLLTGRVSSVESGLNSPVFQPATYEAAPLELAFMSEEFHKLGYATHMIGKWDLGNPDWNHSPLGRGFDTFLGLFCARSTYFTYKNVFRIREALPTLKCHGAPPFDITDSNHKTANAEWGSCLWEDMEPVTDSYSGTYSTNLFAERAVQIIEDHTKMGTGAPFFMLLAPQANHHPYEAPASYIYSDACSDAGKAGKTSDGDNGRFSRKIYCGMMQAIDEGIRNITDALKATNQLTNTVIVFSSDNGGPSKDDKGNIFSGAGDGASNWPYRGQKEEYWEGGAKVPAFIWGEAVRPGSVHRFLSKKGDRKSSVNKELFHVRDWFLTLQALVTEDVPDFLTPNIPEGATAEVTSLKSSFNQLKQLRGGEKSPRLTMVYDAHHQDMENDVKQMRGAIRNKDYKVIFNPPPSPWTNPGNPSDTMECDHDDVTCLGDEIQMFDIVFDAREMQPLDLLALDSKQKKNFDELSREFCSWYNISVPHMIKWHNGVHKIWHVDLFETQGLPRYNKCHFGPFSGTDEFPIEHEHDCSKEDLEPRCGEDTKSGWHALAGFTDEQWNSTDLKFWRERN